MLLTTSYRTILYLPIIHTITYHCRVRNNDSDSDLKLLLFTKKKQVNSLETKRTMLEQKRNDDWSRILNLEK